MDESDYTVPAYVGIPMPSLSRERLRIMIQNTEYRIHFPYTDTVYLETGPSAEAIRRIPIQGMPIADEMCERGSAHYDAWSPR